MILEGGIFDNSVFFLNISYQLLPEYENFIFVRRVLSEKMEKQAGSFSGSAVRPAQPTNLKLIGLHFFDVLMRLYKGNFDHRSKDCLRSSFYKVKLKKFVI